MVVVADAGKRQQLVAIGDRHRADVQLLDQHLGHLHAILFVESLTQDPLGGRRHLQRRGGKGGGVLLKHRPFIQQNAHKQRRTDGIGDHHRRGNALHQMQGVLERAGNQQNDHHLHQLGHEGDRPGGQRAKDFVRPAAFDQHAVHQTAQQPLNDGGDHAA